MCSRSQGCARRCRCWPVERSSRSPPCRVLGSFLTPHCLSLFAIRWFRFCLLPSAFCLLPFAFCVWRSANCEERTASSLSQRIDRATVAIVQHHRDRLL